jgi:branched-chain amino acid transport system ATP-binding protein
MLSIEDVRAGYDGGQVLHGVSIEVPHASICAVVGPNGAGKTTLVHAIAGLVPVSAGVIRLGASALSRLSPHRIARAGVGLVPQGRRVFASLTVAEHFTLAEAVHRREVSFDRTRVLALFPQLGMRLRHRGDQLSGGEQQMLAIARALLVQPRLLLLDEPCEGLVPVLADRIRQVAVELAKAGVTVLLVEQQLDAAADVAHRTVVLEHGRITQLTGRPT